MYTSTSRSSCSRIAIKSWKNNQYFVITFYDIMNEEITIYFYYDETFYLSNSSRPFAFLNAFRPLQREVLQRQTRARIILTTWLLQLSSFNAGAWLHDLVITKNWKVRWTLIKSYKRKTRNPSSTILISCQANLLV